MATVSSLPADQPDRERARIEADPEWADRGGSGVPGAQGYAASLHGTRDRRLSARLLRVPASRGPGARVPRTDVLGSINLGFILMAGLFVLVWALVRAYVKVARDRWDPQAAKVIAELPEAAVAEPVSPASGGARGPLAGRPDDAGGGRAGRGEAGRQEVSR
jgi:hypothetical protein